MKKIVLFLLIFFPLSLFSQTWTKEYPNDSLGKKVDDLVEFKNKIYHNLFQGHFSLGGGLTDTINSGTKLYILNPQTGNSIDSSNLFSPYLYRETPYSDSLMYALEFSKINTCRLILMNNFQIDKNFDFPPLIRVSSNILHVCGRIYPNEDYIYYRFDSTLHLIDSSIIQYSKFLINGASSFPTDGSGNLYYNERTKKYWFSNFFRQVVLDSSLTPIEVWAFQTYDDIQSGFSSMTSPTQIEMPTGSIYAVSSAKRTITLSGPPWGLTKHLIRVTKWNENYQIEDSLEFSYFPNQDTQYVISSKSISWKNNPNEIYVCASTSAYDPMRTQVIVAKIDSSLNTHWVKSFKHPSKGFTAYGIEALEEGGAIIYGTANSGTDSLTFNHSGYLIRIDSTGAILTTNDPLMRVEKDFITYPNPAKNYLYFSVQHDSKPIDVQIFDALGALVYQEKNVQQTRLSLEGWSTGIYVYRVRCEDRVTSGKVVKE